MSVIECTNLTKSYCRSPILKNVTFSIEENKITGLIGRNGAGKTTLLKISAGFWRETSGKIDVFNERPFNSLKVSANTIFIDNQMYFPPSLKLTEILDAAGHFYERWDGELAQRLFNYFSFNPHYYPGNLSKGLRSTFNMIVGLCSRSALTIFDEPTTGMDAAVRKDFYRALLKDYISHPRTIIISSHHLDEIESLLEDVLLLKDGKTMLHIPISELKEWAIKLTGKKAAIEQWIQNRELLFSHEIGADTKEVVTRNNFTVSDLISMKSSGLTITQVPSSDTCMYLTSQHKGGIDDVFNRS